MKHNRCGEGGRPKEMTHAGEATISTRGRGRIRRGRRRNEVFDDPLTTLGGLFVAQNGATKLCVCNHDAWGGQQLKIEGMEVVPDNVTPIGERRPVVDGVDGYGSDAGGWW
eukprot:TRINITY_DN16140_c0_g1_i1.p1 TRINITY_DN16140_c0_g1~~TRINITY_DN16140_c0_g1_i1.p1  ORF type:complete len:111 (+),score=10.02 TRINITY_DN16140_c0_g1_i1:125-457(+)